MTDSVGARLREARELRRLSLQQVSEITKLRIHYLQALENDDYSAIPSAAQARGFLRNYAEFLALDLATLVPPAQPASAPPSVPPAASPSPSTASPRPGLWSSIRNRITRAPAKPDVAPAPVTEPVAFPPVMPEAPAVAAGTDMGVGSPSPASAEVKTKTSRRAKTAPDSVKKNAAN